MQPVLDLVLVDASGDRTFDVARAVDAPRSPSAARTRGALRVPAFCATAGIASRPRNL